ncbi:hypothetical protein JIN84_05235 [Luteolibacter yonseiensis]|uniref:Uncharacterized protein n=1 Tax=Luteolibacter yonseiensis TaxID=1144680 RepID=A0A934R1G5_9BACT|nr:hypothetical protein [Luteolibacter yonseiensis]MBK1815007.1 hypothetical protein [Luteolibacter yonseiensis]
MEIERTFQNISEGSLDKADQQSYLVSLGWSGSTGWQELLRSKRVLIISEAGAGKTYECESQCKRLWDAGEPAFHLELATLAGSRLRDMLDLEQESRFEGWLISQCDVATFFLDSIDELKLSRGSFKVALTQLAKECYGKLGRMRIIITTRPIPFDEQLVRKLFPVPQFAEIETSADGETFAQIALHGRRNKKKENEEEVPPDWRTVALMPLSDSQISDFAQTQGVDEPEALLKDLRRRNAEEFARRPQDLIELCADWRNFKRIRTHREQVESNVRIKLKPREDRRELSELSVDKAMEGASRLALAMMGTRRLTIRHSAEADSGGDGVPLDPSAILSDWSADERKTLLERPLFGFASYGRVRFHHRSVPEYLAAERIKLLRERGMTSRALRRLLFAATRGKVIVRPSKRPIAGWIALTEEMVFETLRDYEPAVLLTEGDPESLSLTQKNQALSAYAEHYSKGGWRGLSVPHIQIHRFAVPQLSGEIKRIWMQGIENPEIREILLNLIEVGRITECLDIAYAVAMDVGASRPERFAAIEALAMCNDLRVDIITAGIAENAELWPDDLAQNIAVGLFPKHLKVNHFFQILGRLKKKKRGIGDLSWQLPRLIVEADLDASTLEALRDGLFDLASAGLRWQDGWPHIVSNRDDLSCALATTCVRSFNVGSMTSWIHASNLALQLPRQDHGGDEAYTQLQKLLAELTADRNAQLFWAGNTLIQSIHPTASAWERYYEIIHQGAACINSERDLAWIKEALFDSTRSSIDRALLLEAAMRHAPSQDEWRNHLIGLKPLVADELELLGIVEDSLKPQEPNEEHKRWEKKHARQKKRLERKQAETHVSWVNFWSEIANQPDTVFSLERRGNTAWYLWNVMSKAGDGSRASSWNRRFIEEQFGKEIADRLRLTLMEQWRKERPTLRSERPDEEKNTYLVRWLLGLAAIYAEAEDVQWATKLSDEEAKLVARFAAIGYDGLPLWMEALVKVHSAGVVAILGRELLFDLESDAGTDSMLLQNIDQSSEPVIDIFLPILRAWLNDNYKCKGKNVNVTAQRIVQVVHFLIKNGDKETRADICAMAHERLGKKISIPVAKVWLPVLMRLDPSSGVNALEARMKSSGKATRSRPEKWIGDIFDDRHDGINLSDPQFTPQILLRLVRLAYRHVHPADDAKRDDAERARSWIVNALLKTNGEEGWTAKWEMASDPVCAHFKDRIIALAEEQWAEEIDGIALDEEQVIALDKTGEAPPSTNEAMFAMMLDRLSDLEDLLLRDDSPRELWAGITEEKIMRRAIAEKLNYHANGLYKIGQEGVTADEKETDIRLLSTTSLYEAVIELKLADGRSAKDLRDTLETQLVEKYMAPETRRSGCLMFTLSKNRYWDHPDTGSRIGFTELADLLREEANRIVEKLGAAIRLHVCALDLRPRLPTEAKRVKKTRNSKNSALLGEASIKIKNRRPL